ncbi:MAG: hypothetical protein JSS83_26555 [Cyanobacteria bacterium SZAS LIN-3]|nr:hypothetical protein [Cyanobacteria bacterium SZAS LIN-3]
MTRYSDDSDFIDPRALSQGDGYGSSYSANQAQFDDYRMAPPGRVPSYQTVGYVDGGNVGDRLMYAAANGFAHGTLAQSIRNQQMALSMETYGAYPQNYSHRTWDGGTAWDGNQGGGRYYRDMQMRRMYEQEAQRELYYRNTTPRFRNYDDMDQSWYLPSRNRSYRPVNGYDPDYDQGYAPRYQRNYRPLPDDGYDYQARPQYRPVPQVRERSYPPVNSQEYTQSTRGGDYWDDVPVRSRQPEQRQTERFDQAPRSEHRIAGSAYDQAVYDNLYAQAEALSGHSIQEFDRSVPVRLGCARAVSLLVNKGYGFPVTDQSIRNLEQTLRKNGFTEVSIKDMKPGDVICGYREAGDYPHGAVYMGNGQIFNNDSDDGVMEIQSIAKYNKSEFKHFVILRRPETVPAVARNDYSDAPARTADRPVRRDLPQNQGNDSGDYWDAG